MKLKLKYKNHVMESLMQAIDAYIEFSSTNDDDDDKLLAATLMQVRAKIYDKLGNFQQEYTMSFTPAEAIAMRIFQGYYPDVTTCLGNALYQLANQVHQKFIS